MTSEIICSPPLNQEFSQLPKFWANKYDGWGTLVNPSTHPQHTNDLIHLLCMLGVDMETIPCGSGALTNAP